MSVCCLVVLPRGDALTYCCADLRQYGVTVALMRSRGVMPLARWWYHLVARVLAHIDVLFAQ